MAALKETLEFPSFLVSQVNHITSILSHDQKHEPSKKSFRVFVDGEAIDIPCRVYYSEHQILQCIKLTGYQGIIALCLGTRHHNGYIREKCLEELFEKTSEFWAIPYIIELMGEYILPILQIIDRERPNLNTAQFRDFYFENKPHYSTICRRVVSYWNEYYREQYPKWHDYPGYHLIKAFEDAPFDMQAMNLPKY